MVDKRAGMGDKRVKKVIEEPKCLKKEQNRSANHFVK